MFGYGREVDMWKEQLSEALKRDDVYNGEFTFAGNKEVFILEDDHERMKIFAYNLGKYGANTFFAQTSKGMIEELQENNCDVLFLDHDLGGQQMVASGEDTGYEVAKWLSENKEYMPKYVFIHSFNPVGAINMKALLPESLVCPGAWNFL